jgi:hypothetical protein
MPNSYEDLIYGSLSDEPMMANEAALRALMRLALRRKGLRCRQSSEMSIFWRK